MVNFPLIEQAKLELTSYEGELTLNRLLCVFGWLTQANVEETNEFNPDALSPENGQAWILATTPTAGTAWEGHGDEIALWLQGWIFFTPKDGARVVDKSLLEYIAYNGTDWETFDYTAL